MNLERLFIGCFVLIIILEWCYNICKITMLLHNRSLAKKKGEDLKYKYSASFTNVSWDIFGCLAQIFLMFLLIRNQIDYLGYREVHEITESQFFIACILGLCAGNVMKLILIIISLKLPLVITANYFIINGNLHKSSTIVYSYIDEKIILAKKNKNEKMKELIRISTEESKIIQVVRKYSSIKDISLITRLDDESNKKSSGY